jgi:hypothetical protein
MAPLGDACGRHQAARQPVAFKADFIAFKFGQQEGSGQTSLLLAVTQRASQAARARAAAGQSD